MRKRKDTQQCEAMSSPLKNNQSGMNQTARQKPNNFDDDIREVQNQTTRETNDYVDNQQTAMRQEQKQVCQPVRAFDFTKGVHSVKWVPIVSNEVKIFNKRASQPGKYTLNKKLVKTEGINENLQTYQLSIEQLIKCQNELKKQLVLNLRKTLSGYSGSLLKEILQEVKDKCHYLFGEDNANEFYQTLMYKQGWIDKINKGDTSKEVNANEKETRMHVINMKSLHLMKLKEKRVQTDGEIGYDDSHKMIRRGSYFPDE